MKLMPGGLRPGTNTPFLPEKRAQILHHWHMVHTATGQPFTLENALPEDFIYDTEPACRAVVTISLIESEKTFSFFAAIQHAFYIAQEDVTRLTILTKLAANLGISESQFASAFQSDNVKRHTQRGFQRTAQWGISGFPSLVIESEARYHVLTTGYRPTEALRQLLNSWLRQNT